MGFATGTGTKLALKQITASPAWGTSPVALGANDAFEYNSDSMDPKAELIENMGITGALFQRTSSPGSMKPDATISADAYFKDSLWRAVAGAFGADAITTAAGKTLHSITPVAVDAAKILTLASFDDPTIGIGVREFNTAKVKTLNLSVDESNQRAAWEVGVISHDYRLNVGSASVAFVVASVAIADGALTILAPALAEFNPSPLTITKAGTVSAITVTIVYIDRWNRQKTQVATTADFVSNLWTGLEPARRVVSAVVSASAGSGNISMGVSNGVNNESNRAAVTTVSERDVMLFGALEVLMNAQGGAALAAATPALLNDAQCVSGIKFGLELNHDQRVTTCTAPRIDEPQRGGSGSFAQVTLGLNFSAVGVGQRQRLLDLISKDALKAKLTFTGPVVSGSSPAVAHTMVLYLNGLQELDGAPMVSGPGVMPMDLSLKATTVTAVPTGFPTGFSHAASIELTNGETAAYWS